MDDTPAARGRPSTRRPDDSARRPEHPISPDCAVDCLRAVLPGRVVNRLGRLPGIRGEATAPATVADVARLYQHGRLGEIRGLGIQSIVLIGDCLCSLSLTACAWNDYQISSDCPVYCLLAVISPRVVNRLAGPDRQAAAAGGAAVTVADVLGLYRRGQLGQVPGLGTRAITEIEAGLILAGFSLQASRD